MLLDIALKPKGEVYMKICRFIIAFPPILVHQLAIAYPKLLKCYNLKKAFYILSFAQEVSIFFSYESLIVFCVLRFFRQFILLFAVHLSSLSMFRFLASVFQTSNASMTAGTSAILIVLIFSGFIITQCKVILPLLQSHSNIIN